MMRMAKWWWTLRSRPPPAVMANESWEGRSVQLTVQPVSVNWLACTPPNRTWAKGVILSYFRNDRRGPKRYVTAATFALFTSTVDVYAPANRISELVYAPKSPTSP